MFRMRRCSPTFLKLTTICEVSHVISFTRPSSPLFFPTREEGLGTRLCILCNTVGQHLTCSISDQTAATYKIISNVALKLREAKIWKDTLAHAYSHSITSLLAYSHSITSLLAYTASLLTQEHKFVSILTRHHECVS